MPLNHRDLCEIGQKFLKRSESANGHGCHFAIIEPSCYGENPDVFGVRHGVNNYDIGTVVLEAKVSRADFLRDKKKPHKIDPTKGMGKWRYYICPTNLIKPDDLPPKWGLIYVSEKGTCKIIAGAMAVKKKKYEGWNGSFNHWRDGNELKQSFLDYAHVERNTENEMNLLAMALARFNDPEQILYMQREFSKIKQQNDEMKFRLRSVESSQNLEALSESLRNLTLELESDINANKKPSDN